MTAVEHIETGGARVGVWREAPSLDGMRTAALGSFACDNAEEGAVVLQRALNRLAGEGYQAALGPMDGDTWSTHRFVVGGDGSAAFLMEPQNPSHYPAAFEAAGLSVVARYVSNHARGDASADVTPVSGVSLRPFDVAHAEHDLRRLYCLSLQAFSENVFYKPITEERFLAAYGPLVGGLDPELSLLAEDETGDLVGFLFGFPNYAEGPSSRTAVVKTIASTKKGVAAMMLREAHLAANRRGFTRIIHALMNEANPSVRLSQRFGGSAFRHYALWGKRL